MTGHPAIPDPRIGVLLINLGTPDAPEERAVRRYLAEFLSDRRVVEIHPIAWKPILHGFILRTRPKKSAEAYNQVWTNEGSPLRAIAHRQAEALRRSMPDVSVHYAMRYGHPGIAAAL
jgi:ferrochelatase